MHGARHHVMLMMMTSLMTHFLIVASLLATEMADTV
jgi:hypothetical protein